MTHRISKPTSAPAILHKSAALGSSGKECSLIPASAVNPHSASLTWSQKSGAVSSGLLEGLPSSATASRVDFRLPVTMIRRGRAEGWLREPIQGLPTWATFHGIQFHGIKVGPLPGHEERGSTVIADRNLDGDTELPLMTIPKELILSKPNIELLAKSDHHLRHVLQALEDFGRTTRGAILTFLLIQASICCPYIKDVGVHTPLTEYIKYLPDELLPTFWTEAELELLEGTTLRSATRAKMNSLLREFETFRTATKDIAWCAKYWWDEEDGLVCSVTRPEHGGLTFRHVTGSIWFNIM